MDAITVDANPFFSLEFADLLTSDVNTGVLHASSNNTEWDSDLVDQMTNTTTGLQECFSTPRKEAVDMSKDANKRLRSPKNQDKPTKKKKTSAIVTTPEKPTLIGKTKKVVKKRRKWTTEEDEILLEWVQQYGSKNAGKVYKSLTNRTARGCRARYNILKNRRNPKHRNGRWKSDEDETLRNLVDQYGEDFNKISAKMQARDYKACWTRWNHHLKSKEQHGIWEQKDMDTLRQLFRDHGEYYKFKDYQWEIPLRSTGDIWTKLKQIRN